MQALGCGRCRRCAVGEENDCELAPEIRAAGGGLGRDGGMAEYMLVPSVRFLVPLGDLDPVLMEVGALGQAGLVTPEVERFALADAHTEYPRMRDGRLHGRAVITP